MREQERKREIQGGKGCMNEDANSWGAQRYRSRCVCVKNLSLVGILYLNGYCLASRAHESITQKALVVKKMMSQLVAPMTMLM